MKFIYHIPRSSIPQLQQRTYVTDYGGSLYIPAWDQAQITQQPHTKHFDPVYAFDGFFISTTPEYDLKPLGHLSTQLYCGFFPNHKPVFFFSSQLPQVYPSFLRTSRLLSKKSHYHIVLTDQYEAVLSRRQISKSTFLLSRTYYNINTHMPVAYYWRTTTPISEQDAKFLYAAGITRLVVDGKTMYTVPRLTHFLPAGAHHLTTTMRTERAVHQVLFHQFYGLSNQPLNLEQRITHVLNKKLIPESFTSHFTAYWTNPTAANLSPLTIHAAKLEDYLFPMSKHNDL